MTAATTFRLAQCRSCNALIIWGRTRNDVSMPVDAEPTDDGNVLIHPDGTVDVLGPLELLCHDRDAEPLRMPHHATCPDGPAWSRR